MNDEYAKQTFLNLPEERQKEIIDVCIEEFALKEYESASLSSIIQKLGLAKGSFYRYFDSKRDLYMFLLDHVFRLRVEDEKGVLTGPIEDLFELLEKNFGAKIEFDLKYPLYSGFVYNALHERNNDELGDIQGHLKKKVLDILVPMIRQQVKKGYMRKDADIEMMAFMIMHVQFGIYDYLKLKYDIDYRKNIMNRKPVMSVPAKDILKAARGIALLLKEGLTNRKK